jgi:ribosomal-protein-alanine N-acetyltransferase
MSDFLIRPYEFEDLQSVLEVFESNVPYYFAPEESDDLKHYLENEIEDYFVLLQDGKIIGAGGINYDNDLITARLSWDFMDKNIQKKGAGSVLTQYRINHVLSQKHILKLIVRTSQFADGFYKKQGFKEVNRIKDYWAKGYDMVLMEYQGV